MSKWIGWKTAVGRCNRMPKDFKKIFLEEVKCMDDKNLIRILKIQRNSRNGNIELHLDVYSDSGDIRENLPYVTDILLASMKLVKEKLEIE